MHPQPKRAMVKAIAAGLPERREIRPVGREKYIRFRRIDIEKKISTQCAGHCHLLHPALLGPAEHGPGGNFSGHGGRPAAAFPAGRCHGLHSECAHAGHRDPSAPKAAAGSPGNFSGAYPGGGGRGSNGGVASGFAPAEKHRADHRSPDAPPSGHRRSSGPMS